VGETAAEAQIVTKNDNITAMRRPVDIFTRGMVTCYCKDCRLPRKAYFMSAARSVFSCWIYWMRAE